MLPRFWVASTKRCNGARAFGAHESARISNTGATENTAARSVIAGQKHGEHSLEGHSCLGRRLALRRGDSAVLPGRFNRRQQPRRRDLLAAALRLDPREDRLADVRVLAQECRRVLPPLPQPLVVERKV